MQGYIRQIHKTVPLPWEASRSWRMEKEKKSGYLNRIKLGKCVLSNHSISNHFAGSISKQHLRTTLISTNIQPFCGKYRQIIQPFHLISTSKDILPLLLYPTGFQRYPTIWNDSNPYPTIAGLSNHFSKLSNRLDRIKTISNHFRFIQPLSNCLDRFKPISNRFRFIQPFL